MVAVIFSYLKRTMMHKKVENSWTLIPSFCHLIDGEADSITVRCQVDATCASTIAGSRVLVFWLLNQESSHISFSQGNIWELSINFPHQFSKGRLKFLSLRFMAHNEMWLKEASESRNRQGSSIYFCHYSFFQLGHEKHGNMGKSKQMQSLDSITWLKCMLGCQDNYSHAERINILLKHFDQGDQGLCLIDLFWKISSHNSMGVS